MKKQLTLIAVIFALFLGSQNMLAQNAIEIDRAANAKTKELRKTIKIDDSKLEAIFQAYKTYEKTYQRIDDDLKANAEQLNKINTILDGELKEILNEEQFIRYLSIYREI